MASLGSVTSTAITGGDAPIFVGVEAVQQDIAKASSKTDKQVQAVSDEVAELKDLVRQLLAQNAVVKPEVAATVEDVPEEEVELTPAEKSAKTKAENKAKAAE